MSTVNLGTWNTKLIYPLLMGFFSFLTFLSYKALRTVTYFSNSQKKDRNFNQKPFLIAWILSLSEAFVGILFYIQMKRSVRMNHAIGEDIQIVSQSLEILPGKRKLILLLKIIPVCLLDCVSLIILSILRESNSSFYELDYRVLLIIVTTLLSVFFLKYQYYKHHMFGISLILIGIIIFTVIETKIKNSQDEYFLFCCSLNNSNMYGYSGNIREVSHRDKVCKSFYDGCI